jgi:hypothetical protein
MKNTNTSLPAIPKQQQPKVTNMRSRAAQNEAFFSSFIDLIPARVYMNPDDRHQWIQIVSSSSSSTNQQSESDPESDTEIVPKAPKNRFDPRFFKTVSQILKDLQSYHQSHQSPKRQLNLLKRPRDLPSKSTALKVFNKSQHKSLTKNQPCNVTGLEPVAKKPSLKRSSKFKEEKRAEVKRARQRYDSESSVPQIVQIPDHSQANSAENRKPVYNKSGQVVYSKFDFESSRNKKPPKDTNNNNNPSSQLTVANAKPKDYKKLIKKLQSEKERNELFKVAEPELASQLELKTKWKSAIDKASGLKLKDDVDLLKKSVKKMDKKREKSKKGWSERSKLVEQSKRSAQEKRQKNMDKRKDKNRENKMKKLKKKGRVLPGF